MEKDKIFFGESGLTSTSANFIANMAKEYVQNIQDKISDLSPFAKNIGIIGEGTPTLVEKGITTVEGIENCLNNISKAYSLIAWLREALKAKDNLLKEIRQYSIEEYCRDNNIELPKCPECPHYLIEDDILATWNIKERNRYYYLSTKVAQYGKFIHPNQPFAMMRKALSKHPEEWIEYTPSGRDTIITYHIPTISLKEVNEKFYELQTIWRESQAELNAMKHKIQLVIDEDTSSKMAEYNKNFKEYSNRINSINSLVTEYITKRTQEISNLKIVIPNELQDIYKEVKSLTK